MFWAKYACIIPFRFAQDEHSEQTDEFKRAGVIVSNHVSYLDILYHMSSSFPSFVAKVIQKLIFWLRKGPKWSS